MGLLRFYQLDLRNIYVPKWDHKLVNPIPFFFFNLIFEAESGLYM